MMASMPIRLLSSSVAVQRGPYPTAAKTVAVVAVLAVLSGCGGGGGDKTPKEMTLGALHTASVKAGLSCENYTELEDTPELLGDSIREMGSCGSEVYSMTYFTIYADHGAAEDSIYDSSEPSVEGAAVLRGPRLLGANWVIEGQGVEALGVEMGGEAVPADAGYDEHIACQKDVLAVVAAFMSDQTGETTDAMQQAMFTYGANSEVFQTAIQHVLSPVARELGTSGLEAALWTARAEASAACLELVTS